MRDFGLSVDRYEKSHALRILDYREWYVIEGEFDIGRTFSL